MSSLFLFSEEKTGFFPGPGSRPQATPADTIGGAMAPEAHYILPGVVPPAWHSERFTSSDKRHIGRVVNALPQGTLGATLRPDPPRPLPIANEHRTREVGTDVRCKRIGDNVAGEHRVSVPRRVLPAVRYDTSLSEVCGLQIRSCVRPTSCQSVSAPPPERSPPVRTAGKTRRGTVTESPLPPPPPGHPP